MEGQDDVPSQISSSIAMPKLRPRRSKKILPCDFCRSRKVACVREEDGLTCSLCMLKSRECTFESRPAPRKRPYHCPFGASTSTRTGAEGGLSFMEIGRRTHSNENISDWTNPGMNMHGFTCFYAGSSGDQGSDLLRHLSFNEQNRFGDSRWGVWRILPRVQSPVYFTASLPSLEHRAHPLTSEHIELVTLYYAYVHPSYPIIDTKDDLMARVRTGHIRISLQNCICLLAVEFWHKSDALNKQPAPDCSNLWNEVFLKLVVETRTPNTDTVKALLLYMQLPSRYVTESNRPGQWALSTLLVGAAQDIGLNIDPSDWQIPLAEQKSRRVLWWAVYAHDKWISHWLGRPSHIHHDSWDVKPLVIEDFWDDSSGSHNHSLWPPRAFIAFTQLSLILDDVLRTFYGVRCRQPSSMLGHECFSELLASWAEENRGFPASPFSFALYIGYHTLVLSSLRAIVSCSEPTKTETLWKITKTLKDTLDLVGSISISSVEGFWVSYSTGNLQVIGSILLTLCLSSIDDEILEARRKLLFTFRTHLLEMSRSNASTYETARLPLNRLNLILEQIFPSTENIE